MGECFLWYRPTRVVPDQRPLNGRRCCCTIAVFLFLAQHTLLIGSTALAVVSGEPYYTVQFLTGHSNYKMTQTGKGGRKS